MFLKDFVRFIISSFKKLEDWSNEEVKTAYKIIEPTSEKRVLARIWDFLQFSENTQAFHLANSIGFEEWIDMEEIRRRIHEIFNISYKNERSLYPYLKTLVDLGLVESSNVGGRRKWRKKELLIDTSAIKKSNKELEVIVQ